MIGLFSSLFKYKIMTQNVTIISQSGKSNTCNSRSKLRKCADKIGKLRRLREISDDRETIQSRS